MNNTLKEHAHSLRLSGLLQSLELRLQEAEANRLPYAQFLELLFQDEINVRHHRFINRRQKLADFRELRSLESFDGVGAELPPKAPAQEQKRSRVSRVKRRPPAADGIPRAKRYLSSFLGIKRLVLQRLGSPR